MAPRRGATPAEISLVQLRSCLVNLPSPLVSILVNSDTAAQDAIVELQYRTAPASRKASAPDGVQQSLYLGWTGMASQRRPLSAVARANARAIGKDQEYGAVEMDASFARMIGLVEGQKVGVVLHVDPPLAHTINIEPLTPGDWEIIELHASFLETNLQAQIRALPNPSFAGTPSAQAQKVHPLTLHLSPTSTANIIVSSLMPPVSSTIPFAKLAPDAEVIVAPKIRPRLARSGRTDSRSVASASQRSIGGKSGAGAARQGSHRSEARRPIFLRAVDGGVYDRFAEDAALDKNRDALRVWVDGDILGGKGIKGDEWVSVSVVQPGTLQAPMDAQQQQKVKDQEGSEAGKAATKVVARIAAWDDAPDSRHAILSSSLCAALGTQHMMGGVVRIEAAPQATSRGSVKRFKIYPFVATTVRQTGGLKFGGETRASRDAAAEKIKAVHGRRLGTGLLDGPLTDGQVLPCAPATSASEAWDGGILRFEPPLSPDSERTVPRWVVGEEASLELDVQQEVPNPFHLRNPPGLEDDGLPVQMPFLVGVDGFVNGLVSNIRHGSSVLLNGGPGSGKTSIAQSVACRMRRSDLYNVNYFSCRKLMTDETRISTIKEKMSRLFMRASWGARLGGKALVVLDDLDRLCPAETELQVGGENGRSRHVSELLCSIIREYCAASSGVVLLATAQGKDALHATVVGGHVLREMMDLKAPDKDRRRQVLKALVEQQVQRKPGKEPLRVRSPAHANGSWMDGSGPNSRPNSSGRDVGSTADEEPDLLDIAGRTDGYMPGDLVLLLSRARSEALIRSVSGAGGSSGHADIRLVKEDFDQALKGFTPASLRNVTLQSSSTTFASIGGLKETRKVLLETLQYPTTYAPIFARCPLRLRSGLLLYGYPGCGKTLLASAVAGECGLNFISVKGPEILNKYIGASEKSVRDLFERAEAARPCVLFFDEFDSIAPKRGHDSTGVTDRVVNQLLTQMDGAEGLSGVYVLAATSRPDLIDPALLRPGRLDKSLLCDMPSEEDRLDILRALSTKLKIGPDVLNDDDDDDAARPPYRNLREMARRTEGYSGADLQAVAYNAHLEAIHDVLGDHKGAAAPAAAAAAKGPPPRPQRGHPARHPPDVVQFRFGEDEERREAAERAAAGHNRSKQTAESAALAAKLDALKVERRGERAARRRGDGTGTGTGGAPEAADEGRGAVEVVIGWKHLEASLATTRSSIGRAERRKLEAIYREFVVGRNGEMPSGQGGVEVGARSSLM